MPSPADYNTQHSLRVDWADLDLFGHVNNVAFFRYIQSARVHYCESIGLTSVNDRDKLSFMVASSQCRFKKPLFYPNGIVVHIKADWLKNSSLQLAYRVTDRSDDLVAEGEDVLVVFDHHKKEKVTIPESLRETIRRIENNPAL